MKQLAKTRLRPYKPGKYGKGTIPDEEHPEAQIWRTRGGWDGDPHHDDVSEALGIARPMVTFHIDKQRRFYFHHSGDGHLKPKDPAGLARAVVKQHPELTWGRQSVEQHEASSKTLAMNGRALRPFEQGAHLHVLDWTHSTVRHRFQQAGQVQVKAAAKSIVNGNHTRPPELPALEAAIHAELAHLYAVGHATVRSELDHQAQGRALPIGLSKAPEPPGLRHATQAAERCGTCRMFDNGACWGYGNFGVEPDEVCDSWAAETVKTLALADRAPDRGHLAARAALAAQAVAHQVWQATQRALLGAVTDKRALKQAGRAAGMAELGAQASHHAGAAINAGRRAAAAPNARIIGARYTSVLDKNTCGPCQDADTGELIPVGDPRWIPTPNPACLGGGRCRCIHVYQLATENRPSSILPPDDFPAEPRQPDRPSGVSRLPVAAVGVGSS